MNIKKPFLTNVWHRHWHEVLVIFSAFGLILLLIFLMTKARYLNRIFLLHALMLKISICHLNKGFLSDSYGLELSPLFIVVLFKFIFKELTTVISGTFR